MDKLQQSLSEKKILWRRVFLYIGPILAVLVLSVSAFAGHTSDIKWLDQVMMWVFAPLIILSLLLIQRWGLTGSYGETILLLIPTFVWLLPGHAQAINIMVYSSLAFGILTIIFSVIGVLVNTRTSIDRARAVWISSIFLRLAYVLLSVIATLIFSVILINWGDNAMGLANDAKGIPQYDSSEWITFIAVITILVAFGLVTLGLLTAFSRDFKRQNDRTIISSIVNVFRFKRTHESAQSDLEKTLAIKLPKRKARRIRGKKK